MPKEVNISEFAERVERLCNFFIDQAKRDGSDDIKVIQELKEDAANLQFSKEQRVTETLDGLAAYMKGASIK